MDEYNYKRLTEVPDEQTDIREKPGTVAQLPSGNKLDDGMLESLHKLIDQIGRREREGFMYIMTTDPDPVSLKDDKMKHNGILFTHKVSLPEMARLLLNTLKTIRNK